MKVLTSKEMREIDRKTIEEIGIPGPVLMENAGIRITGAILKRFPRITEENVVIVAGKGNNGGDGFVVARHLFNLGARPNVLLLASKQELKGDAALNLGIAEKIGVEIAEVTKIEEWKKHRIGLFHASVIVDAIFGTGLLKPAEGLYATAIEDINKAPGFKVAVDIPSGLSSDTHLLIGPAVKADLTVALAAPKIGHVLPPAEEYVGELVISDISIPPFLFEDESLKLEVIEKKDALPYVQKRKRDSHKGTYGHLFVLAGSLGKTGAAVMAAKAALRMGAGLVTVGTPQSCWPVIARSMMELMTEALPETPQKTISEAALPMVLDLLKGKDAVLIGPGISAHPSTAKLVVSLMPKIKVPAVIDADGLNILAENPDALKSFSCPAVLTPHPGEFARLIRRSNKDVLDNRLELAAEFAEKYKVFLVLKGYRTLVATPRGKIFINPTGNPGMATGGSGDVLSGMIASLIIQEKNMLGATAAAVYLHGLSGDIGAKRIGERPLIAGDLIKYLPQALKEMES
ncbi:MAG: NAD(P)H-hydrate dehydratase [Candidatus Aminicenantes bacterium]|nr:NAD(P)H-hydrate dehydratase [Candidatus Aminicenantes bacterium]